MSLWNTSTISKGHPAYGLNSRSKYILTMNCEYADFCRMIRLAFTKISLSTVSYFFRKKTSRYGDTVIVRSELFCKNNISLSTFWLSTHSSGNSWKKAYFQQFMDGLSSENSQMSAYSSFADRYVNSIRTGDRKSRFIYSSLAMT